VSLGVFHPRRQHVQETRGCISRHARLGGSYELEDGCYGARRRLYDYGERFIASAGYTVEERQFASAGNTLEERQLASTCYAMEHWRLVGTDNVPLIAALGRRC
jgi:hypothetical protein